MQSLILLVLFFGSKFPATADAVVTLASWYRGVSHCFFSLSMPMTNPPPPTGELFGHSRDVPGAHQRRDPGLHRPHHCGLAQAAPCQLPGRRCAGYQGARMCGRFGGWASECILVEEGKQEDLYFFFL